MGRDTDDAASRLHLLDTHYREHPNNGPTARRSPSINPGAPLNLGILDYFDNCRAEVIQHTRTEAGDLPPLPARIRDLYDWWEERTEDAAPEVQLRRDIVIYRQSLEHAMRLGEYKQIRKHPCPHCRTWGLQWQPHAGNAICLNRHCRDRNGMARTWSLASLATQYVTEKENRSRRAT